MLNRTFKSFEKIFLIYSLNNFLYQMKKSDYKRFIEKFTKEENSEKEAFQEEEKEWLLCSICKNRIAKISDMIEVNSKHKHTFMNPHGLFFNIRCFKEAIGCVALTSPTEEFTWFPGYSWQVTVCNKCQTHNGWKFNSGNNSFFGLIENKLFFQAK